MKMKILKAIIISIVFFACVTNAAKIYVTLNTDGNYITNVPTPVADSHAINKRYADQMYAASALNALPAKCAGGQISGYTPIPGEDLYADMQHGVDWSTNTRFTVDSTGSNVYDNLTGLMWTKNANLLGYKTNWYDAIDFCTNLVYGGFSDWRLPNPRELESLMDTSENNPPLPLGHPFDFLPSGFFDIAYWSSSTSSLNNIYAFRCSIYYGWFGYGGAIDSWNKNDNYYVWPVRSR